MSTEPENSWKQGKRQTTDQSTAAVNLSVSAEVSGGTLLQLSSAAVSLTEKQS